MKSKLIFITSAALAIALVLPAASVRAAEPETGTTTDQSSADGSVQQDNAGSGNSRKADYEKVLSAAEADAKDKADYAAKHPGDQKAKDAAAKAQAKVDGLVELEKAGSGNSRKADYEKALSAAEADAKDKADYAAKHPGDQKAKDAAAKAQAKVDGLVGLAHGESPKVTAAEEKAKEAADWAAKHPNDDKAKKDAANAQAELDALLKEKADAEAAHKKRSPGDKKIANAEDKAKKASDYAAAHPNNDKAKKDAANAQAEVDALKKEKADAEAAHSGNSRKAAFEKVLSAAEADAKDKADYAAKHPGDQKAKDAAAKAQAKVDGLVELEKAGSGNSRKADYEKALSAAEADAKDKADYAAKHPGDQKAKDAAAKAQAKVDGLVGLAHGESPKVTAAEEKAKEAADWAAKHPNDDKAKKDAANAQAELDALLKEKADAEAAHKKRSPGDKKIANAEDKAKKASDYAAAHPNNDKAKKDAANAQAEVDALKKEKADAEAAHKRQRGYRDAKGSGCTPGINCPSDAKKNTNDGGKVATSKANIIAPAQAIDIQGKASSRIGANVSVNSNASKPQIKTQTQAAKTEAQVQAPKLQAQKPKAQAQTTTAAAPAPMKVMAPMPMPTQQRH